MCNQTVCEVGVLVMLGIFGSLFALAEPLVLRLSGIGLTARKEHNHGLWWTVGEGWDWTTKLTSSGTRGGEEG